MNKIFKLASAFKMKCNSPMKQVENEVDPSKKGIHKADDGGYVPDAYEPSSEVLSVKGKPKFRTFKDSKGNLVSTKNIGSEEEKNTYKKFQQDSTATMAGRNFNAERANLEMAADKAMNKKPKK